MDRCGSSYLMVKIKNENDLRILNNFINNFITDRR
jgi:hypothetical protein